MEPLFRTDEFIFLESVTSTNDVFRDLKRKGSVREGTLVVAKNQIAGRGRMKNKWISPPDKNLTFSFLLKPEFLPAENQFLISMVIALGLREAIASFCPESTIKIKWPNDVYCQKLKIAGVLIENIIRGNNISEMIVGIGINVNQREFDPDLPNPTSLHLLTGKQFIISELLTPICECIEKQYVHLKKENAQDIEKQYNELLLGIGEQKRFIYLGKIISAKIIHIDPNGLLCLKTDDGELKKLDFSELKLIV